jgi:hypothetical protein
VSEYTVEVELAPSVVVVEVSTSVRGAPGEVTAQDLADGLATRATAAQGAKADTAVQPAALAPYLTSAVANSTFVPGQPVSTDGTDSLHTPTGVGLEFVINADGLDDIRFNGVSL